MASGAGDARGLRAELGEVRAQLAERDRVIALQRDEIAAVRASEAALRDKNQELTAQVTALVERVTELERRLGQSSQNSHRPPSSDGYAKPKPRSRRERTDRDPGGQPGHEGTTLAQVHTPDERVAHTPVACPECGGSLTEAPVVSAEARQVFDLPQIALRVTEHVLEHRRCACGCTTMAAAPAGVAAPAQYGPGVRGLGTYLLAGQHLPLARTAELLGEVLHAPVSQGSLASWYAAAAAGLDPFCDAVREQLVAAAVVAADETGIRVDGDLAWLHVARTEELTCYTVSGKRGAEAMHAAGVLPNLSPDTVLVTDFWAPYWNFDVTHAVCGAHLGRELAAAAEVDGQADWAEGMDRLLAEINRTCQRARDAGYTALAEPLLATYQARYDQLIDAGWAVNPDHRPGRGNSRRP
ncbi:MAG: IS66 family transposase, partial [Streptosporangiales bacterium]